MAMWDSAEQLTQTRHSHPWLAKALFALDARVLRGADVAEYSHQPRCIFRLEIDRARRSVTLRDGTRLRPGQRIARLHFWNEHIPPVPRQGATIRWAHEMQQSIAISLQELARHLSLCGDLDDVAVICGDVPSGTSAQRSKVERIMEYYGFEAIPWNRPLPFGKRLHRFGENILISLTVFALNATALHRDTLGRVRVPIFLSRRVLEQRFGASAGSGQPAARRSRAPASTAIAS